MESLARTVALVVLAAAGTGAALGGTAAYRLAALSPHRSAYAVAGAVLGGIGGWLSLVAYARTSTPASSPSQIAP